jgi:2-hydroxy-6-oxonona-2,4-dienedioate hydrolase
VTGRPGAARSIGHTNAYGVTETMTRSTPSSVRTQFVDVNGIRTRYFETGDGPPLVLIHGDEFGGAASASTWDLNLPGLGERFHVFAPDRLGQGFTDNPPSDAGYTAEAVVQHLHAFMRALDLPAAHIIGQSRGSYVATRLVLEYPDLCQTLVIVDTASLAPEMGNSNERLAAVLANPPSDPREYARFRWSRLSYSADHITDAYLDDAAAAAALPKTQAARPRIRQIVESVFMPSFRAQKEETLRWLAEGRLRVPTLVVWGRNDVLAPFPSGVALFELIAERLPQTRLYVFNESGHYPYREHAAEFNRVVTSFITEAHPNGGRSSP